MRSRGFTLIELLVSIVIIGLLVAVASSSYTSAQRASRDNRRKADVAAIASAVESHYRVYQRFPGISAPAAGATNAGWEGCFSIDSSSTYSNIAYYSFPTTRDATAAPFSACSHSSRPGVLSASNPHTSAQFAAFPNWIPGMAEFLNPIPFERRYLDQNGTQNPLPTGAAFAAADVLKNNQAQTYIYRHLEGGYAIYARLEQTDTAEGSATGSLNFGPRLPGLNGGPSVPLVITQPDRRVFMIRK